MNAPRTVGDLLDELSEALAPPGVPPSRTVARDLIAGVLRRPRYWPSAHRDTTLGDEQLAALDAAVARLRDGMPIQYALGYATFRHLDLLVDRRVLIPRPETELLVDLVLAAQRGGRGTVVDVGTGSGAIALSLAAEGSFERVVATDRSPDALAVARANLAAIPEGRRAVLEFRGGDLLAPLDGLRADAIVSNPPYISREDAATMPRLVLDWEPAEALFADEDGMAVIRALVPQAAGVLLPGGLLALEVDSRRATLAADAVSQEGRFTDVELRHDLTGRPRFVMARRKEQ